MEVPHSVIAGLEFCDGLMLLFSVVRCSSSYEGKTLPISYHVFFYIDLNPCVMLDCIQNRNSKLTSVLSDDRFTFHHKMLLTGTPIQNNVSEFWTLLNFCDEEAYDDLDEFLEKYGDMKDKETVDKLHEEIRPYILRRLKEDVEKSVPPKEETLIEVELTMPQKQYYRALYERNVKFLYKNKSKALDGPSLNNLAMQLRKVCSIRGLHMYGSPVATHLVSCIFSVIHSAVIMFVYSMA